MVNHNDLNISRDARSRREPNELHTKSSSRQYSQQSNFDDDVIASLANAPENRRARQVGEWERLRRQIFPTAS